jgi:hypothetical protein
MSDRGARPADPRSRSACSWSRHRAAGGSPVPIGLQLDPRSRSACSWSRHRAAGGSPVPIGLQLDPRSRSACSWIPTSSGRRIPTSSTSSSAKENPRRKAGGSRVADRGRRIRSRSCLGQLGERLERGGGFLHAGPAPSISKRELAGGTVQAIAQRLGRRFIGRR